jgi:hypothetical protein
MRDTAPWFHCRFALGSFDHNAARLTSQFQHLGPISTELLCELRMRTKRIEPATGPGRLPPKRPPAASISRRRKARVVAFNFSRPSSARLH